MHLSHYVHSKLLESNFCIKIGKIGSYSTSSEISRAFVSITMFQCQHTRTHYLSVILNLVLFLNDSHYDMQVHVKLESAETWRFWRFFVFVFYLFFFYIFSFILFLSFFFFKKKQKNYRICDSVPVGEGKGILFWSCKFTGIFCGICIEKLCMDYCRRGCLQSLRETFILSLASAVSKMMLFKKDWHESYWKNWAWF